MQIKFFLIAIVTISLAFHCQTKTDGVIGDFSLAQGQGGPDNSPEDVLPDGASGSGSELNQTQTAADASQDLLTDSGDGTNPPSLAEETTTTLLNENDEEVLDGTINSDSDGSEEGNEENLTEEQIKQRNRDAAIVDQGPRQECSNRKITLDISQGRWFKTEARGKIKGIHTFWARQKLILNVKNNCQPGYYKLKIVAKNINGPLAESYKRFNIAVYDLLNDKPLGGMLIKASDDRYHHRGKLVYLNEGDSSFNLSWLNDSYKKGEYDANIQIRKVKLKYKRYIRQNNRLSRRATNFCATKGRWFFSEKTAYTYWANQEISYCFKNLKAGKYKLMVKAKNKGTLPPEYPEFKVKISADGISEIASVKADQNKFQHGHIFLDLTGGDTKVSLRWLNDKYKKGQYDANIEFRKIRLKRVGKSERSALSAYLSSASTKHPVLFFIIIIGLLGIATMYLMGKKNSKTT